MSITETQKRLMLTLRDVRLWRWESTISCIGSKFAQSPTIIGQPEVINYTETCKTMLKPCENLIFTAMVQVNKQTSTIRVSCSDASFGPSNSSSSTPYQLPVRLDHIHLPIIQLPLESPVFAAQKYMLSPLIFLGGVNAHGLSPCYVSTCLKHGRPAQHWANGKFTPILKSTSWVDTLNKFNILPMAFYDCFWHFYIGYIMLYPSYPRKSSKILSYEHLVHAMIHILNRSQ